jgi:hypothetical protein
VAEFEHKMRHWHSHNSWHNTNPDWYQVLFLVFLTQRFVWVYRDMWLRQLRLNVSRFLRYHNGESRCKGRLTGHKWEKSSSDVDKGKRGFLVVLSCFGLAIFTKNRLDLFTTRTVSKPQFKNLCPSPQGYPDVIMKNLSRNSAHAMWHIEIFSKVLPS